MLITLGEPAGIGPDVVLGAFLRRPALFRGAAIVAPASWLQARANELGLALRIERSRSAQPPQADEPMLLCWWPDAEPVPAPRPGQIDPQLSRSVIRALQLAAEAARSTKRPLVTAPIEKHALIAAGWPYPGHTEMLAAVAGASRAVMMLACRELAVALVTTHLALSDAIASLRPESILTCARIVDAHLRRFGFAKPRLALCALNPHAGEHGRFGREEIEILAPSVAQLRNEGVQIEGPLPADSAFAKAQRARFDAYICLYHDQGLIPLKALCFGEAVNITLGLGFVRTSPDHGAALALAGTKRARCDGMLAAIEAARALAQGRWPWANDSAGDC